jgi:hypothetical protein
MMPITMSQRDALFEAGYAARKAERPRATATCVKFAEIMKEFPGFDLKTFEVLCHEWYEGFDAYTDDIIAATFDDDEFFLAKTVAKKQKRAARLAHAGE